MAAPADARELTRRLVAAYRNEERPATVHLDVTHRCDYRCEHCYLEQRTADGLDTAAWRAVLDDLAGLRVFQVVVGGGEPFLRPDLLDLLAHARALRFAVALKTHGGHIDEGAARALRRLVVHRVDVSVYALDEQVHDAVTRAPGSLARTLAAAAHLRAAGVPVRISCPAMARNASHVPAVAAFAAAHGFGFLDSAGLHAGNRGAPLDAALGLTTEGTAAYAALELALGERRPPDTLPPEETSPACGAAWLSAHVDPAGDVRPCVMWPEAAGNVTVAPFSRLWREAPLLRAARAVVRGRRGACAGCALLAACTPCPARALAGGLNPLHPSAHDCALARARCAAAEPDR